MTVTLSDHPTWPDGDPGKVLLNCMISTSVDEVFEELFGSYPQTQAKLHKQRNDTNCAESPWVAQRSQLPAQQFVWPAPPAGADAGTPAQGAHRKVRFDAAPSIASKAFSSEEIQRVLQYRPGSHYQLETEVYTTAMYGDQFTVISRYTLAAKGTGKAHLHVLYAIAFKASLSRLMKPMVAKGVDGGIRGSFSVLKKLLQEQYGLSDLPDTAPAPTVPGAPAAAAEAPPAPALAAAAPVPAAAAAAAMAQPGLLGLADYVVYQELVASLVQVSDPQLIAKGLATCLTLGLIHVLISCLRPISQACAAATAGTSGWVLSWLCWPQGVGLDPPDSLGQVLGALLLVAVANKLLLLGVEVAAGALKGGTSISVPASRAPSSVWASRAPSMLGAALSAVAEAASSSAPSAAAAANGSLPPVAEDEAAAAAGSPSSSADQQRQQVNKRAQSLRQPKSSPVSIPGKAANGSGGGGSGGGVEAALSNFSNAVTGWGRNLLGAGVVESLATNEGIKALVTGTWAKPSGDAGQGPGSTPAASEGGERLSTAGSGPGRTPSHRHTNSFTAVMDPSGLNIIEDYAQAQQEAVQQLPQLLEENSGAASSPATSEMGQPGLFTAAAAAGAAGARAAASGAQVEANEVTTEGSKTVERPLSGRSAGSSSVRSVSPSKQLAGRSSSPSKLKDAGSTKKALTKADAEARQPLLSALSGEGSVGQPSSEAGSNMQQGGPGQGTSRPSTPGPGDDSSVPPLLDSASPIVPQGSSSRLQTVRSSKSVTFSRSPNTPDGSSGPLPGSHSAAALLSGGSATATPAGGPAGSAGQGSRPMMPLARRSASPMLYGASPDGGSSAADSPPVGRLGMSGVSASYEALSASSGSSAAGYPPPVEPGQEDADEVLVEVFEHERVQPFRGWGHTWPGHFLPSDKVGHWGDRTGAPGGAVSMLFDRVAPKLPRGWTWQDDEWAVDMTGANVEGCDAEGWSYGMDFSWITWPPAPQMGKPGLKSFVRRRRWVRMRARLAPGDEPPAAESSQQASPVLVQRLDPLQQPLQTGSAPNSARDSDGGFMAGLSSGLGLVSHDSASAAAAAAGAMVSRFMKAVQDLPLAPRGSSGGSELGLGTSPPSIPTAAESAGAAASAAGRDAMGAAATSLSIEPELSVSSAPAELAAAAGDAGAISAVGAKQRQQGGTSSKSSNAGSSRQGGDSGNVSDSDSSSVNSDSPPPRPQLSAALAELRQEEATGLTQPAAAAAAAAAAIAAAGAAAAAPGSDGSWAPDSITQAAFTSTCTAVAPAADAVSAATAGSSITQTESQPNSGVQLGGGAAAEGGIIVGSKARGATLDAAVAVPVAAAAADTGAGAGGSSAGSAAAPPDEQPQEGLPAPHTPADPPSSALTTPATEAEKLVDTEALTSVGAVGPAEESPLAVVRDDAAQQDDVTTAAAVAGEDKPIDAVPASAQPAAVTAATAAVEGSSTTSQPAGSQAAGAAQLPVPQDHGGEELASAGLPSPATAAAGGPSWLLATCKAGKGTSPGGTGDWVWSAAAATAEASCASAALQQQPAPEPAGEAGPSPVVVAGQAQHHVPSGVSRSSSGGTPRSVVRTGSGARGSRGKQSKLGAVPLRRSSDGSPAGSGSGAATESGVAHGAGGCTATLPVLTAAPPGASAPAAAAGSVSRLGVAAPAAASGSNCGQAASAVRRAPSGGATNQQQQKTAQAPHVSGDDMGSGLGWESSPDKQWPSAVQTATALPPAQQEEQQDAGLEEAEQQGWQEW